MFGNFIGKFRNYFYSHYHFCPIKLSKMRLPIGIMLFILLPQTNHALTEQILKIHYNQTDPSKSTKIDTAANDNTINLIIVFLLSSGFFFFRIKYTGSIK